MTPLQQGMYVSHKNDCTEQNRWSFVRWALKLQEQHNAT